MKKFEYKMLLLDNAGVWIEAGAMEAGFKPKYLGKPVSLKFADELGSEGWELFNVVDYSMSAASVYFFRREKE